MFFVGINLYHLLLPLGKESTAKTEDARVLLCVAMQKSRMITAAITLKVTRLAPKPSAK